MINPNTVTKEQFVGAFGRWANDVGDLALDLELAWKQFRAKTDPFWHLTPYLRDENHTELARN